MEKRPRERDVEKYLARRIYKLGGTCYKWRASGDRGVPDRICILPWLGAFFVEVKSEAGFTTRLQEFTFKRMKESGALVFVVYGHDGVDALIDCVVGLKRKDTGHSTAP